MAVMNQQYLAGEDIAQRAGVLETAYMTEDGRFVLDVTDLKRVRLLPEEYITGLDVEPISKEEAQVLISENHYRRYGDAEKEETEETEETLSEEEAEAPAEAEDETEEEEEEE